MMGSDIGSIVANEKPSEQYLAGHRWFLDNVHTLGSYSGQYVAVLHGQILSHGSNLDDLRIAAAKISRTAIEDIFVEQVPRAKDLARPYDNPVKAAR